MPIIQGMDKVLKMLKAKAARANISSRLQVVVAYKAPYAIFVHEDMEAKHPNGGQAKYLETPFRLHRKTMLQIVRNELRAGNDLRESMLRAGKFLLNESKKLVPVDTGYLKDSGYVELR